MLQLTHEFKQKVVTALLEQRDNFSGSDAAFAKQWSMNNSVFSRIKSGDTEKVLRDAQWLNIGRELGVSLSERKWNMARTDVFNMVEQDIVFCQTYGKARICVDESEIGKTHSAKYLARTLKNCFYVDASQAKTKQLFIRLLAKSIGIEHQGKYAEVIENLKYYLRMLPNPVVIVDEVGDLDHPAFLELKGLWNATENCCGWYMIGDDSLRTKLENGMRNRKGGYRAIFSRYLSNYSSIVPVELSERRSFYRKLITDVLTPNMPDKSRLNEIVKRCLIQDGNSGHIGGLRRAESLLILSSQE